MRLPRIAATCLGLALAALLVAGTAAASCLPMAQRDGRVVPASLRLAAVPEGSVALTFLGHASFLIESPAGVTAVTDYNGYNVPAGPAPDIATMNHAHSTHYTDHPDPGIRHVLRGWSDGGGMARHQVRERDMLVRNVPTNIRDGAGTERYGNSIFVFEVGDLCIAHLGHLHHVLTPEHLGALGQIDVVLVPVDGSYTLAQARMLEVLRLIKAPLVVPMHYFSTYTLQRFLEAARDDYAIRTSDGPRVVLSRATLPAPPEILVLPGD